MALRNPWEPPAKIEKDYSKAIRQALSVLLGIDTMQDLTSAAEILTGSPEWHELCRGIAARMVTNTLTWEDKTWRQRPGEAAGAGRYTRGSSKYCRPM